MKFKYKGLLFFALIISFILWFPHLYFIVNNGFNLYDPLSLKDVNPLTLDENLYSSGIQEVMNGNLNLANSQVSGHADIPSAQMDYVSYYTLGFLGIILGKSINNLQILGDFLFPFIIIFLLYWLLKKIDFINMICYFVIAVIMILGLNIFTWFNLFKSLFSINPLVNNIIRPLEFSRLVSPQFVLIFLLIAIILLYLSLADDKNKTILFLLMGIFGGLLFYIYFYYAIFFWSGFSFLFLFCLIQKKYVQVKKLSLSLLVGLFVSIFYIINLLKLRKLPYYNEIALRVGAEFPTIFSFWHIVFTTIIVFAILCLLYIRKNNKNKKSVFDIDFLIVFLLGSIVCINLHIFLGYTILYLHFWERIIVFWVFISLVFFLQDVLLKKNLFPQLHLKIFLLGKILPILLVFILFLGFYSQLSFSLNTAYKYKTSNEELELYKWLNENTLKDSTVLTLSIASNMNLVSHTHNNLYLPHSFLNTLPREEIIDRFVSMAKLFNLSEDDINDRINSDNIIKKYNILVNSKQQASTNLFEVAFWNYYLFHEEFNLHHYKYDYFFPELPRDYFGFYLPKSIREEFKQKYLSNTVTTYKYDYILVGPYEKQFNSNFDENKRLFFNKNYVLYKR